ncbi:MAG: VCBS repeat-containing protein [Cyclobacteriaceae bacterium]|nr:VCBS repeat-containing protein [Cyclobacteriaceae bacterium]
MPRHPSLRKLGMVTDAVWADIDGDKDADLVVVGEWMPVTIFINDGGILTKVENTDNGLQYSDGWWQSIEISDLDKDGDMDFILGNMGFNYKFKATATAPLELYYGNFDGNNTLDIAMGYYENGKLYPVYEWSQAAQQTSDIRDLIKSNNQYSISTLQEIYGPEFIEKASKLQAFTLATSILKNSGNGKFDLLPMPNEVQISAINSILIKDIDMDGNDDLLLAGNFYPMEVRSIRNDAGIGAFLKGNGKGDFTFVPNRGAGLFLSGDVRHMAAINHDDEYMIVVVKNNDRPQVIKPKLKNPNP